MAKITIIGGGSYTWGPTFLRDVFATPELSGSTVVLEDIRQDRLDLVFELGQKMIDDFQLDFHLEKTLTLEEALGSRFRHPDNHHRTAGVHAPRP